MVTVVGCAWFGGCWFWSDFWEFICGIIATSKEYSFLLDFVELAADPGLISCYGTSSSIIKAVAYLSLSALAAASQSSLYGKQGQEEFQWIKICNMYGKFCNQAGEGVASVVVVTLSIAIVSSISAYSLFRLYGRNKRQGSGRW
ncbi:hypothetical protein Drorol1_Dr00019382 [Drosera rotundifolia]